MSLKCFFVQKKIKHMMLDVTKTWQKKKKPQKTKTLPKLTVKTMLLPYSIPINNNALR